MIKMIPNKNLDPNYNYLSDAIDATGIYQYKPEDYHFCDDNKVCEIKININGKCYKDPDGESNRLYQHLSLLTGLESIDGKAEGYKGKKSYMHLVYNCNPYTSDYIGVSKYWAQRNALYTELEIGKFLNIFRTIGGHMIWPSSYKKINGKDFTINTARGGRYGVFDRIDMTLYAIKCYYLGIEFKYSDRLFASIKNENNWFDEYGKKEEGFKLFIDSFLLNDFVDQDYNVLSLVYDKPIEEIEKTTSIFESRHRFDVYVEHTKIKIINRSNRMCGIEI